MYGEYPCETKNMHTYFISLSCQYHNVDEMRYEVLHMVKE